MESKLLESNGEKRFDALNGYSDVNKIHYDLGDSHEGPYDYVQRDPFYYYLHGDAFVHPYEEDPTCNQPKGYITFDDPLDQRESWGTAWSAMLLLGMAFMGYAMFAGSGKLKSGTLGDRLYEQNITAEMIEDEIREIRKENARLEKRLSELENKE